MQLHELNVPLLYSWAYYTTLKWIEKAASCLKFLFYKLNNVRTSIEYNVHDIYMYTGCIYTVFQYLGNKSFYKH